MLLTMALAASAGAAPIDIGTRTELFVDRYLVERMQGVSLRLTQPVRREVVLVTDQPWEGPASAYYTGFLDGGKVRLYYRGFCPSDVAAAQVTCTAESDDGIHFTRPRLGLYDFDGSRENNIVYRGVEAHNFAPFLDTNPACKPDERYKALGGVESKLYAFASPDGYRWRKLRDEPVMTKGAFDSLNTAFWDAEAKTYRCYSRYWQEGGYSGARAIQSTTSADFVSWETPKPNAYAADAPVEHFYTNATRPCPGAEHILLSFPKRFVPGRTKLAGYNDPGVSDGVFLSSRDGVHWDRTFLEAWLRPGPDPHNWTQRSNMPATGVLQLSPDEFTMYASEHYEWPDNRLRRLTVRRHGFASVHADAAPGEFVTKPLRFAGAQLVLNYATSAAGSVRVEIQDEVGKPVPGFAAEDMAPLFGDELDAVAMWKGGSDVSKLAGKVVRLRFLLRDADLYAIRTAQ